jgi:MFS transporter, ACS family, glucarate transporter
MEKPKLPFRFLLIFLSFLLTVLLYVDRACISTAKDDIMHDLNFTVTQFGWIMAVFTLGYALLQTPSGKYADKHGPRKVITSIVSFWSVLTAITGFAWNYVSMLIIRFLFGAGEAGAFPALSKVVYNWFPVKERGIVQGINFSGSRIGAALGLPLVAILIESFGWRHTFLIFGVAGVIYAFIWYFIFKDKPEESKLISENERNYILENRQQSDVKKEILPFSTIMKSKNMWLAMVQYVCSNFTFYFTLTWMYPYIKEKFMLGSVEAGMYAAVPLIAGAIGNWFSGILVDLIYAKGHLKVSRQLPAIIGFILAAVGMIAVTKAESPLLSVIFMSLAVLGADMTLSPSWAFCIDIGKENAGAVSGTMNMAGNLGAFVTIIAYPYLFQWTGSNEPFFYVCAALSIIAIAVWFFMKPELEIRKY